VHKNGTARLELILIDKGEDPDVVLGSHGGDKSVLKMFNGVHERGPSVKFFLKVFNGKFLKVFNGVHERFI
jgi:hypothetical protein